MTAIGGALLAACLLALLALAGCMAPGGGAAPGGFGCAPPARPLSPRDVEQMTRELDRLLAMNPNLARARAEDLVKQAKRAAAKARERKAAPAAEAADPGRLLFLAGFAYERAGAFRDATDTYQEAQRGPFGGPAALRMGEVLRLQLDDRKRAGKTYDAATAMVARASLNAAGWLLIKGEEMTYQAHSFLASDTGVRLAPVSLEMAALYRIDQMRRGEPLYKMIATLVRLLGANPKFSYGLALIILALVVTIVTAPLTSASFKSMRAMQRLQPLLKEMQEKHKGDRQAMAAEQMRLMKKHKVNPLGGCLPMLIQMPILIAVYYGIRDYRFQFAQASFVGIGNLAHPNLPLLVLYAVSMYLSQKLTTLPTADPQQQQMQRMMTLMMPIMFLVLFQTLPSAFILYWLSYNVFFTARQYYLIKRPEPERAAEPAQAEPGSRRPTPGGQRRKKRRF